jgi:hypothetical protein
MIRRMEGVLGQFTRPVPHDNIDFIQCRPKQKELQASMSIAGEKIQVQQRSHRDYAGIKYGEHDHTIDRYFTTQVRN